jgi:hypothetical protein
VEEDKLFMIRLCSDGAAYEAIPKKRLRLDIGGLKRILESRGDCEIALWTPQFMVFKWKSDIEVTIVDDGKMIIRNVETEEDAKRIAETIVSLHS